ncbi:MAG: hypothetical protein WCC60_23405 [Ilumatobacteraceae bacterium]
MDGLPDLPQPGSLGEPTAPLGEPTAPLPAASGAAVATGAFPASMATAPGVSVVIHEEPKKRRTGLLVGVGVLLAAAVGGGGYLLLKDDEAAPTYSLTAAAANAAEAKQVAFTLTMSVMGEEIVAEAETDATKGVTHMTMDIGGADLGIDGSLEMIVDTNEKVFYMKSDFFEGLGLEVDTDWIKMDEQFLKEQAGTDADIFGSADVGNPLDAAKVIAKAKSVVDLGFDEVDGVKVQHYEVVVDTQALLDVSPQLQQQFDQLDGDLPDDVTYDVYVDEQNLIRRTSVLMKAGATKVEEDIVIRSTTEPVVVEVPAAGDVTDIVELM